ncbi:MAG TPA: alpha/beta hydrolase [Longimicrobiales bacterium]|nr:alpha/beta hydrolase [Longimicrobiales bacterium]
MTWEQFRELPPAPPGERVAWGGDTASFGELRRPSGPGPHPVAVVIHGGCWRTTADLSYMRHVAGALPELGLATWSIEFRRVDQEGAAWPAIFRDVGRAVDHLRKLADVRSLDLERVVTVGHSSGGHLALWTAARTGLPSTGEAGGIRGDSPLRISGVVGLAPITGLEDFHGRPDRSCPETAVPDLLGGGPDLPSERLDIADPARLVPLGVPQLLVTGALDDTVPPAHVRAFAELASAAGDRVTHVEVERAGHFEVVAPWTDVWSADVAPAIRRFIGGPGP